MNARRLPKAGEGVVVGEEAHLLELRHRVERGGRLVGEHAQGLYALARGEQAIAPGRPTQIMPLIFALAVVERVRAASGGSRRAGRSRSAPTSSCRGPRAQQAARLLARHQEAALDVEAGVEQRAQVGRSRWRSSRRLSSVQPTAARTRRRPVSGSGRSIETFSKGERPADALAERSRGPTRSSATRRPAPTRSAGARGRWRWRAAWAPSCAASTASAAWAATATSTSSSSSVGLRPEAGWSTDIIPR